MPDIVVTQLRLPAQLHKKLKVRAARNGNSMNSEIVRALEANSLAASVQQLAKEASENHDSVMQTLKTFAVELGHIQSVREKLNFLLNQQMNR